MMDRPGHDALWLWFGLSYASWLTIPRVLMHEMPDEWQGKMAELLQEYDETFPGVYDQAGAPFVMLRSTETNKFMKHPDWMLRYRHPDKDAIDALRPSTHSQEPDND